MVAAPSSTFYSGIVEPGTLLGREIPAAMFLILVASATIARQGARIGLP